MRDPELFKSLLAPVFPKFIFLMAAPYLLHQEQHLPLCSAGKGGQEISAHQTLVNHVYGLKVDLCPAALRTCFHLRIS